MTVAEIIVIVVVAVFGLLALGGFLAGRRRAEANEPHFVASLKRVNQDLAAAHAEDNGWEPVALHDAARAAFDGEVVDITLIQVIDPPGVDDDKAVFHVVTGDGQHTLTLGRQGGQWHRESVTPL